MKYEGVWDYEILKKVDSKNIEDFLREYELDPTWYIFCKDNSGKDYMLVNDKLKNKITLINIDVDKKLLTSSFGGLEKGRYEDVEIKSNLFKTKYKIMYKIKYSKDRRAHKYIIKKNGILGNQKENIMRFPEIIKQYVPKDKKSE